MYIFERFDWIAKIYKNKKVRDYFCKLLERMCVKEITECGNCRLTMRTDVLKCEKLCNDYDTKYYTSTCTSCRIIYSQYIHSIRGNRTM